MATPRHLQRQPEEWEKAVVKYDRQRLGMEVLNEYIIFGQAIPNIDLEKYKRLLTKHGSRPYMGLGLQIIRTSYPHLKPYEKFLVGWEDKIDEPDDEFGPFNAKERSKPWNYDAISVEGLLLDWMYERRKSFDIGKGTFGSSYVIRITTDSFGYHYKDQREILIRPPIPSEINWGNDMIELLGAFMGQRWDRWYIKQNGVTLRTYCRKHKDEHYCRKHNWLRKLWR